MIGRDRILSTDDGTFFMTYTVNEEGTAQITVAL